MTKFFSLFLLSVFGLTSSGQNYIDYYNLANEAEYQFVQGVDLNAAKKTFIALDKKFGRLLYKDNFYLGILFYLDNDSVNGFKYFAKFIDNYGSVTYELPKFKKCIPELRISDKTISDLGLLENKNRLLFKDTLYFNKTIKPVNDTINYYNELDQRSLNDSDKINIGIQIPYLNYLKKYGIPRAGLFGEDYTLIFFHLTDKKIQKLYKEFLYDEIMKGHVGAFAYAIIVDKDLMEQDETTYGTARLESSPKTSKTQVTENRKKIGHSPYYNGLNSFPRCRTKGQ